MSSRSEWPTAQLVADSYLRRSPARGGMQPSSWPAADRMTGPTAIYWWDDNTPVFEVSLYDGDNPAGYLIVSGSRRLPPILEAGPTGTAPSTRLFAAVTAHLAQTGRYAAAIRWQYWSPLEMVAEVTLQDDSIVHIQVPEMFEATMPSRLSIQRDPAAFWNADALAKRWEEWLTPLGTTGPSSIGIILETREPIYYNQNCRPAFRSESEPPTYCTPNCISGCVPVAVAMLSSSWKKVNISGSQSQIWPVLPVGTPLGHQQLPPILTAAPMSISRFGRFMMHFQRDAAAVLSAIGWLLQRQHITGTLGGSIGLTSFNFPHRTNIAQTLLRGDTRSFLWLSVSGVPI